MKDVIDPSAHLGDIAAIEAVLDSMAARWKQEVLATLAKMPGEQAKVAATVGASSSQQVWSIQVQVAMAAGVSRDDLLTDRTPDVTVARHFAMWRTRTELRRSWHWIGKHFKLDHSTVILGFRRAEQRLKEGSIPQELLDTLPPAQRGIVDALRAEA